MRLDKWLWAARFFKTRTLASDAVDGGKIKVNGERAKPSRDIKPGDELQVRIGEYEWVVHVRALSQQRGPASAAQLLYEETEASHTRRQEQIAERKATANPAVDLRGRPTKRDRRSIVRFTRGE
jgi:ribosome-associated heat shock protein Hsp15